MNGNEILFLSQQTTSTGSILQNAKFYNPGPLLFTGVLKLKKKVQSRGQLA